ncbi:hypothetical protein KW849_13390 [Pseudomonas sp. PDM26]|uniref:hypothetical protein n=1 Tax=Pseudomonas sp. PDM26 TaxID=2854766 RepID=UPI001C48B638|nr:hypothetical protein [Pseudomonas sp. PDM26]MBV7547283.1 hypothetical protein [Pseudomonas sp. PDM26]
MSQTQDPLQSLLGFQEALTAGFIQPDLSPLYPDLIVLHDDAEGTPRSTYALMEGKVVKAVAVYFLEKSVGNIPYFDVGYAVAEPYRQQGNAHAVVEKSLAQLQHETRGKVLKLFVEAIVPNSNIASQKVAARALSASPTEIVDGVSGQASQQYLRLFEV